MINTSLVRIRTSAWDEQGGRFMERISGDTIKFEWRNEVAAICRALDTYSKEHASSTEAEYAKELADMLDVMYMEW